MLLVLAAAACEGGAARAEAERVVLAVRALREAENDDKPARLAALRQTEAAEAEVSELKRECVSAYELFTKGVDAVRAVKSSLATDAGDPLKAAELLTNAERDVANGKQKATRCAELEGKVVGKYKLR